MAMTKTFGALLIGGLAAALGVAVSCQPALRDVNGDGVDDGTPATTVIAPVDPTGSVSGLVIDATNGLPVAPERNVKVHLSAGTLTQDITLGDGSGRFHFDGVPAGIGVALQFSTDDNRYAPVVVQTALPGNAGNFPTNNNHVFVGPVELVELNGTQSAMLVGPDGRAISGATVYLDTDFGFFLAGAVTGRFHAVTQTDQAGLAKFTGVPNAAALAARIGARNFFFTVPPPDTDTDGTPNYNGTLGSLTVNEAAVRAAPLLLTVTLPTGQLPLRVVASNVADLVNPDGNGPKPVPTPSVLPKAGSIEVAFNQPVEADSLLIEIVGEEGGTPMPTTHALNDYGNIVSIPIPAPAQTGQELNFYIEARPRHMGAGGGFRAAVAFFIEPSSANVGITDFWHEDIGNPPDGNINGGDYIWFRLDTPVGARNDTGAAAASNALLPIRCVASVDIDGINGQGTSAFETGYQGGRLAPTVDVVEDLPEGGRWVSSGYSTRLRLELPAGTNITNSQGVSFTLKFNDATGATNSQVYRVATPQGILPAPPMKQGIVTLDIHWRDAGN